MDKALGVSTTMVRLAGTVEALVSPEHVENTAYFAKYLVGKPVFEWQMALVLLLPVGAWLAGKLANVGQVEQVPLLWAQRFGPSLLRRYIGAFIGGVILLFGARMAGGCTSGHGISGGLQLALSSWAFLLAMFASGVGTAFLLYGSGGRRHV
jgi:uncharacterized membrane protein YedE/YeeE